MKLMHTADWHLGQRLLGFDRKEEHEWVLRWILEQIKEEKVDTLVIAGDIFDTANPPNYALTLYYEFLKELLFTSCQNVVVVGGNHDSPAVLNAPAAILKKLNIHVIGSAIVDEHGALLYEKEVIELKNTEKKLIGVVAAVPFLRDRDLRQSISGETPEAHASTIRNAIKEHYEIVASFVRKHYYSMAIPKLCTGHLYVSGSTISDSERDIHLGDLGRVGTDVFPELFQYVALGHLHRPQRVHQQEHIRYSGSIIPLSFSEASDTKEIVIAEFTHDTLTQVRSVPIPLPRKLKRVRGELEHVLDRLATWENHSNFPDWVEAVVQNSDKANLLIEEQLRQVANQNTAYDLLKIRVERPKAAISEMVIVESLEDLQPEDVFLKLCEKREFTQAQTEEVLTTFRELHKAYQARES